MKRFRFGILSLLVLTAILAVPVAWISWQFYEIRSQKAFILLMKQQSVAMAVDYHDTSDRPVGWLEDLLGHREVKHLRVQNTELSDLSAIAKFQYLERLLLLDTKVTDLSPLENLEYLKVLDVNSKPPPYDQRRWGSPDEKPLLINDLTPLRRLQHLEHLGLYHTQVTDLTPLTELKKLKYLDISFTPVKDLSPLQGLDSLFNLIIVSTDVQNLEPLARMTPHRMVVQLDSNIAASEIESLKNKRPELLFIIERLKWTEKGATSS